METVTGGSNPSSPAKRKKKGEIYMFNGQRLSKENLSIYCGGADYF